MSQGFVETIIEAQSDGTALTAAARATATPSHARKVLQPNFFRFVGQQARLRATGRISCAVTTPGTARFDLSFGGTVVWDSLAIPLNIVAKSNVHWILDVLLTLRAVGSAANLIGQGEWKSEAVIGSPLPSAGGSGVILLPYNTAPVVGANFDSGAQQLADLFFTQTVATGSMTVHQFALTSDN